MDNKEEQRLFDELDIRDLGTLHAARAKLKLQLAGDEQSIKGRVEDISDSFQPVLKVLDLFFPKRKKMNATLAIKNNDVKNKDHDAIDMIGLAVDIVVPFLLDNVFFKGTKGRLIKLVGTVAAQQIIKVIARSQAFDIVLDTVESWLTREVPTAEPYPAMDEAIRLNSKKYRTRSKPEDYSDPEREMFYQ